MPPKYSDHEPQFDAKEGAPAEDEEVFEEDDEDYRPERPRSPLRFLVPVISVLVLAACGVGGYMLAAQFAQPKPQQGAATAQAVAPENNNAAPASDPKLTETLSAEAPAQQPQAPAAPPATPAGDSPAKAEKFDSWFVVCPTDQPQSLECTVQQQLRSAQSKALVFVWAMRKDNDGKIHAVWQMPPGLDTTKGMVLDAGDGKPRTVPIANCDAKSCVVRGVLAAEYLKTLGSAQSLTATIVMKADGKALKYPFQPKGLGAALARIGG